MSCTRSQALNWRILQMLAYPVPGRIPEAVGELHCTLYDLWILCQHAAAFDPRRNRPWRSLFQSISLAAHAQALPSSSAHRLSVSELLQLLLLQLPLRLLWCSLLIRGARTSTSTNQQYRLLRSAVAPSSAQSFDRRSLSLEAPIAVAIAVPIVIAPTVAIRSTVFGAFIVGNYRPRPVSRSLFLSAQALAWRALEVGRKPRLVLFASWFFSCRASLMAPLAISLVLRALCIASISTRKRQFDSV